MTASPLQAANFNAMKQAPFRPGTEAPVHIRELSSDALDSPAAEEELDSRTDLDLSLQKRGVQRSGWK